MKVQVHHVEPEIGQFHPPQQGIHIGAVAVHQSARLDAPFRTAHDVGVEEAQSIGLGDHDPASSGVATSLRASRSMLPSESETTVTTWKPAIAAEAGLVP